MEPHAQCVGKIKFRNLNFRPKKTMWGRENHVDFNIKSVLAWYVVKRLHVPEGTIKFLERDSIKMTQTMHLALEQYWAGLFSRTKSREVFEWYSAPAPV